MVNKPRRFKATLERGKEGMGWTIARLPFDPHKVWAQMIRLRVCGEVSSSGDSPVAFRTSLFPVPGEPGHYLLLVNNRVQREAGISIGSMAHFSLEADLEPRPAELPDELAALLNEEPGLRDYYDSLSESMRREIGKWLTNGKSVASHSKRAMQIAERLLAAMEGEIELPPVVSAAFRIRPKARAGWEKMTQTQRRQELLGVFYYQSVDARARRVEKLCDRAETHA